MKFLLWLVPTTLIGIILFFYAIGSPPKEAPEAAPSLTMPPRATVSKMKEKERRAIFDEMMRTEDAAQAKADQRFPTSQIVQGESKEAMQRRFENNSEMDNRLADAARAKIKQKYKLTQKDFDLIRIEALDKKWLGN